MWDFRLPSGRSIGIKRWIMVGTYSGQYEGSRHEVSLYIRKEISERVKRILAPGDPLAIIEPPKGVLPPWFCVAQLESPDSAHSPDPDYFSGLYVCWFMEDTSRNLDEIIESIMPLIDWDGLAEDYPMF